MSEVDFSIPQYERITRGMAIIMQYETDPYPIDAKHDILYCGNYATRERMTEDERALMARYGWFNEYGAWAFFT